MLSGRKGVGVHDVVTPKEDLPIAGIERFVKILFGIKLRSIEPAF